MASITLTFSAPLNSSCQVGDYAYYVNYALTGGFNVSNDSLAYIGQIRQIDNPTTNSPGVICETSLAGAADVNGRFILFSKSPAANTSSLLGYYAETKFVCTDTERAEIFTAQADVFESSK